MAWNVVNVVFSVIRQGLQKIQSKLAFEGWDDYPQFATNKGLGRVATLSCVLGMVWGLHVAFLLMLMLSMFQNNNNNNKNEPKTVLLFQQLQPHHMTMGLQWCIYVVVLCTFHLLEFFVTAVYNPTVTTSDSFLINHSFMYTAAVLLSWTEFAYRWCRVSGRYLPSQLQLQQQQGGGGGWWWTTTTTTTTWCILLGLGLVIPAQVLRSLAMITCGESFNHLIQPNKKDNHVLITHGIYHYLRHPSYVGFFYWVIGTQLVLGNTCCGILFALATWRFFQRRIYEEYVLLQQFPQQFPAYQAKTLIGIPFLHRYISSS